MFEQKQSVLIFTKIHRERRRATIRHDWHIDSPHRRVIFLPRDATPGRHFQSWALKGGVRCTHVISEALCVSMGDCRDRLWLVCVAPHNAGLSALRADLEFSW
jgi:hypothetical protein